MLIYTIYIHTEREYKTAETCRRNINTVIHLVFLYLRKNHEERIRKICINMKKNLCKQCSYVTLTLGYDSEMQN